MNEAASGGGLGLPAATASSGGEPLYGSLAGLGHCLITGGGGFIGQALLCRLRAAGLNVTVLSRTGRRESRTGVAPPGEMQPRTIALELGRDRLGCELLSGIDTVFHLAARTHAVDGGNDAHLYERTNLHGTRELLEAARAAGCARFVFFSSVKAMGEQSSLCLDETTDARPQSDYGRSKLAAERLVVAAAGPSFATSVLRLPLVYGPGVKGNLRALLLALRDGRMPALPPVHNKRSMIHVQDAVQGAVLAALRAEPGGTYILTDGYDYSTSEIQALCRLALREYSREGRSAPNVAAWRRVGNRLVLPLWSLKALALAGDCASVLLRRRTGFDSARLRKLTESAFYDSRKARALLGFAPRYRLSTALPEMIAALRDSGAGGHDSACRTVCRCSDTVSDQ